MAQHFSVRIPWKDNAFDGAALIPDYTKAEDLGKLLRDDRK